MKAGVSGDGRAPRGFLVGPPLNSSERNQQREKAEAFDVSGSQKREKPRSFMGTNRWSGGSSGLQTGQSLFDVRRTQFKTDSIGLSVRRNCVDT
jgi:hypothetical protein